jgi:hypothetical protein
MNVQLKEKIMAEYPEWHFKPLSLTIAEMENPHKVIYLFFERYTLPQIRACLKDMLFDAIWMDDKDAPCHISTADDVEKLIEAAWQLRISKERKPSCVIKADRTEVKDLPKAYRDIQEFFDSITLPKALAYLKSTIKSAEAKEIWKMSSPNDLLNFFESMKGLLESVFRIVDSRKTLEVVVLSKKDKTPSLNDCSLYCANYDGLTAWDYFPRSLSKKEFRDPYKALSRFSEIRGIREWEEIMDYLLNGALGKSSLTEAGVHLEVFTISEQLHKMIEACHLIYVRTTISTTNV